MLTVGQKNVVSQQTRHLGGFKCSVSGCGGFLIGNKLPVCPLKWADRLTLSQEMLYGGAKIPMLALLLAHSEVYKFLYFQLQ